MASCFCWAVNRRLVLVGLVIDGQSEGHGVTPIDLSTKPGQPQRARTRQRAGPLRQRPRAGGVPEQSRLLWKQSEPAKRGGWHVPTRTYHTRVDPTLGCWHLVLQWLMADPLLTGQQAMQRLESEKPGLYGGSLRTLQRRMAEWRIAHAEQVVSQQMGAIRDQENNQLNRKKKEQPLRRQLNR